MEFQVGSYSVGKTEILSSITGSIPAGKVYGILGPSGAGKSTLLAAIAHRLPKTGSSYLDARITFSGAPYSRTTSLAFCPQDDAALIPCLTVRETLETQGALRLPSGTPVGPAVDAVLSDLGLAHVADSVVGSAFSRGISGGERRRVSVAAELLSRPDYLLLDEPTSGLDSVSAQRLVHDVAALASRDNVAVLMSIHQPSRTVVDMLDGVLVLVGGKMVFMGPTRILGAVLESTGMAVNGANLAEEVLRIVVSPGGCATLDQAVASLSAVDELYASASGRIHVPPGERVRADTGLYGGGEEGGGRPGGGGKLWTSIKVLFRRQALIVRRDPHVFSVRAVMIWLMALIIGGLYFDVTPEYEAVRDLVNVFFFATLVTTFVSLTTLPHAVQDRLILRHEYRSRLYSVPAFVLTTLVFRTVVIFAIVSVFYAVLYAMMAVPEASVSRYFSGLAVLMAANVFAELFMLVMGLLSPDPVIAISIGVTAYGFFMLTSSAIIIPARAPALLRPMFFSSFYRPAIQALMLITFPDISFTCPQVLAPVIPDYPACRVAGSDVLVTAFSSDDAYFISSVGAGIGFLIALILLWILLYGIALHLVLSGKDFGLLAFWSRLRHRRSNSDDVSNVYTSINATGGGVRPGPGSTPGTVPLLSPLSHP